jgi:tetratricopeptide (TPR) repeat protein
LAIILIVLVIAIAIDVGDAYLKRKQQARNTPQAPAMATQMEGSPPQAVGAVPAQAAGTFSEGVAAMKAGRFAEALPIFAFLVGRSPADLASRNNLAVCLIKLRRFQEAEGHLRQVLTTSARPRGSRLNLGVAEAGQSLAGQALQDTSRAIEEAGKLPDTRFRATALYNKGWLLDEQGQLGRAVEAYRLALDIRQSYPEASIGLAIALAKLGRTGEALKAFGEAETQARAADRSDLLIAIAANRKLLDEPKSAPGDDSPDALNPSFWREGWVEKTFLYTGYPTGTIIVYCVVHLFFLVVVLNLADAMFGRGRRLATFVLTTAATAALVMIVWGWGHWAGLTAAAVLSGWIGALLLAR